MNERNKQSKNINFIRLKDYFRNTSLTVIVISLIVLSLLIFTVWKLSDENSSLKRDNYNLNSQISELEDANTSLKSEIDDLQSQIDDMKSKSSSSYYLPIRTY